jgi:predicted nucleotidyltransferase
VTTAAMRETEEASQIAIGELVAGVQATYGDALRVIVRFGSAVAGEVLPGQSDTNLLIIVDAAPLSALLREAAAVRKWVAAGNPAPLLLTLAEWRSSSDVFAMEYADILHRHEVLIGKAPFEGITVGAAELRLHVEREAMGKLLQLRRAITAVGDDGAQQLRLLVNGLSTLMVVFRGVSRVAGQKPPRDYVELSKQVAGLAGFDSRPFERLVQHARREVQIPVAEATAILTGVLEAMGRLVAHLDRAGGSARSVS